MDIYTHFFEYQIVENEVVLSAVPVGHNAESSQCAFAIILPVPFYTIIFTNTVNISKLNQPALKL